jgi:thermopsin
MAPHGQHLVTALLGVIVLALLLPGTSAPGVAHASDPAAVVSSVAPASAHTSVGSSIGAAVVANLRAAHAPMNEVFLPNFNAHPSVAGGVVQPLYSSAPAPMGLGDFGVVDEHGVNVGTISYTSSVKASVTFNSLDPLYLDAAGPDQFTIQENTVLTHVDVLGDLATDYWIQNVPVYYADSHTLVFEDNIWNFSNPGFVFPPNGIYAHGPASFFIGDEVYIGVGLVSYDVAPPFTITTYNNVTTYNDRPTVFFNYTLTKAGKSVSGSYDFAEFNSTGLAAPTGPAPAATYQINGESANPTGYLLNDAEIMIGGPGGGSTTNFLQISGSVGLWTLPNGSKRFQTVPSAYDFGTDTGETSAGVAEYSSGGANPVAELGSGPSLLYPLWGVAGAVPSGAGSQTFDLSPSNAFVFVAPGTTFNASAAAWAPVPTSGRATYALPPGEYSAEILLADRSPVSTTFRESSVPSTTVVTLRSDGALGVYTPLWALDNAQLAAISSGGAGTERSPYVLLNNQRSPINPLFGEFNDFFFPVFPGIFLVGTSAYVSVENAPSFAVSYTLAAEAAAISVTGLPTTNDLEQNYYAVSHVSIVDSYISGWIMADDAGFTEASVVFWNSSDNLVAGNTFGVISQALILFGGTGNTIWGNTFLASTISAPDPTAIGYNDSQFALQLWESGDLIYNNAFLTPITAYTPTVNIYNGAGALYTDTWNVSKQSVRDVRDVNGFDLSGNILGLSYEGGNYWINYGTASDPTGVLPYNNGGLITVGGDYLPLVPQHHGY